MLSADGSVAAVAIIGSHQGRLLRVGREGSASPNTLLTKIFFNR
jgi:hypothetical protein